MSINRLLLAVPAALLLAACGGSDSPAGPDENPDPGQAGTFTGTIAGGIARSVTGSAAFGSSASEGGFTLGLGDDDNGFVFGRELAGIPAVGTHQVWDLDEDDEDVPENAISGVFGLTGGNASHLCYTTGGTITITTSTSTRLAGTLNVTAACYNATSGAATTITLTGQFNGVGGQGD